MNGLTCVVDASVAVKLFLAEPLANQATDLFAILAADLTSIFYVPDLFYAETANIFWKQCQRGARSLAQAQADHAALRALRLQRTPTFDLAADALAIAAAHGITAYDACYVALAQRHGIHLITADDKLVRKLAVKFPCRDLAGKLDAATCDAISQTRTAGAADAAPSDVGRRPLFALVVPIKKERVHNVASAPLASWSLFRYYHCDAIRSPQRHLREFLGFD